MSSTTPGGVFATTHWSVVLAAGQSQSAASAEALEMLCQRYRPPILAFIRWRGYAPADAEDLTQEFFARLLEKKSVDSANPSKGRSRAFLLTAVTRFLINQRERNQAQKRGGGHVHHSLDEMLESDHHAETAELTTPETIYERNWAETILGAVLTRLHREFDDAGERARFDSLKSWLGSESQAFPIKQIASRLGVTEGSVYSAIHRLRKRYGELLREEIAQTVSSRSEIEEELRYLVQVLSR